MNLTDRPMLACQQLLSLGMGALSQHRIYLRASLSLPEVWQPRAAAGSRCTHTGRSIRASLAHLERPMGTCRTPKATTTPGGLVLRLPNTHSPSKSIIRDRKYTRVGRLSSSRIPTGTTCPSQISGHSSRRGRQRMHLVLPQASGTSSSSGTSRPGPQ